MNSKKGTGKVSASPAIGANSSRGKGVEDPDSGTNLLNKNMSGLSLDSQEGGWELYAKKSKNRTGGVSSKPWDSSNSSKSLGHAEGIPRQGWGTNVGVGRTSGNSWAQASEYRSPGGRGIGKQQHPTKDWESQYMAPPAGPGVAPPLQHGWQWAARGGSSGSQLKTEEAISKNQRQDGSFGGDYDSVDDVTKQQDRDSDYDDNDDLVDDSDDDLSDDYDSDTSQKSHETRKKSKWFNGFFGELDKLTVEEINEPNRQWHCPACQNAPGAIDWYKGLQPLMTHAKTKGKTRVKLHRELALLLEEELHRKGTTVIPAGEVFGKWKGLKESTTDHEIIWPPMVIIMNTKLEQDDNDKWLGMGNQELLDYFSTYAPVKSRHSYGPNGHRGMSVLVFEATAMGYLEAERLHKHFAEQGTSRDAWEHPRKNLFCAGGKRQLYGYLARKEDLDTFNYHCQGKSRLKYELKSYQEMVVIPMKQMNEDNQELVWLKNKVIKQERRSKALEETFGVVTQKLRETMEENRIVRHRTKIQHQENKEEMDYQEHFFKEQMDKIHKVTEEKEQLFEKSQQEERAKAKHSDLNSGTTEEKKLRQEEIARFIDNQAKGVEEFLAEREKLIKAHEEKKVELRRQYLEEEVKMEKEFDGALTKLMEKYSPATFQASRSSS
ncbi:protein SUPPRESSOR OF GENE SILENCING 3 homolog [Zingiber officinale]|uniref:protein SUPPRESSOR OF GENE SILENCING 3 homolog n=1 Tax=Zingiber officinale TaxID=94328 RepID=UPI001C4BABA4|nr:protein SUPPRESSOR OF GENE SILENCING 3 homolog [Zingiber officinale]